jgi:uncharacterized protein
MNPFNHNYFVGYVNEVNPQLTKIHFPSSTLLEKFSHNGAFYSGGRVGNFVVIEGTDYGFLARLIEITLPDSERKSISEKAIQNDDTNFHPSGKAELLLSFDIHDPSVVRKTVSNYPVIGAKVYSCSDMFIEQYIKRFGQKGETASVLIDLGTLTSNSAKCMVSADSLFGRHCAVVGTTGGGKSWTTAKLIEEISAKSSNKIILIDATGEYGSLKADSTILSVDSYFPYQELQIQDLFFLLRPTGQSQRPILLEAIRSLKVKRLNPGLANTKGVIEKALKDKNPFYTFYKTNIKSIEDNSCNFDISFLIDQIREECVYASGGLSNSPDPSKWGNHDPRTYDYQTSLLVRIADLTNSDLYNKVLGFSNVPNTWQSLSKTIESFLSQDDKQILRISFEDIASSFSVKEIVANSIATFLLLLARKGRFRENPVVLFVDEAHQFLNKTVKDEFFESHSLDAFDLIAKECRKHGLFICLATQMPRDIPVGTLSQMGTFIVHRLINEQDKKAIESASSAASKNSIYFLPVLGEGEALLIGVDFPMPLLVRMSEPATPPQSRTPKIRHKL